VTPLPAVAGLREIGRRLIALAVGGEDQTQELTEPQIIDAWTQELGVEGWYAWTEPSE